MRILLIEDEKLAADRLQKLILKVVPEAVLEKPVPSVKKALEWLGNNPAPDLAFFDIQLADGLSFEILEQAKVGCPIIFTTAYDEYALKAFKLNSVDYLLKPVKEEDLKQAICKFRSRVQPQQTLDLQLVEQLMQQMNRSYKSRFMVKVGDHIHAVPVEEILYFYSEEKATFLLNRQNKRYIIDYALDHVEQMVDPKLFFRTNRSFLINFHAIAQIVAYSGNRLKLNLADERAQEVLVSREKVPLFKQWLDQ